MYLNVIFQNHSSLNLMMVKSIENVCYFNIFNIYSQNFSNNKIVFCDDDVDNDDNVNNNDYYVDNDYNVDDSDDNDRMIMLIVR